MLELPPLSLYVHLPWCVRKCPYCDFNSHAAPERVPQHDYVDRLLEDLDCEIAEVRARPLVSVFFGGGTPSLFDPEEIGRFLAGVRERMQLTANAEITLEANPGTIEHGRFSGYRDAGVTRISMGAQSFNERHLRALGRIHSVGDIARAVDELRQAGLDNFNLDLMYALPEQSLPEALADLERAIELQPAHISHYQLTLEPGTVFYHRPPMLPDNDLAWEMQLQSQARLAAADYEQYEVSAYAQSGRRCVHNLNYWQFGDYLGIGAGAHGKVTQVDGSIVRTARVRQPREYSSRVPRERASEARVVPQSDLAFEFMLNALRLVDGFTREQFERRTGLPIAAIGNTVSTAIARNLLQRVAPDHWRPTELGRQFLNELQALFLPK